MEGDLVMQISDFLSESTVTTDLKAKDKKEALEELLDLLIKAKEVDESDKGQILDNLLERESLGSTGIGQGIGIPHGKVKCVKKLITALGLSKQGVEFDALDGEKVRIIFLLLAPEGLTGPHLKALAHISRILRDKFVRERILRCQDSGSLLNVLKNEDKKYVTN